MLESLTIDDFRGIGHLDLTDLRRVNIFVGKNASGKTSLLEAASIVANPVSPGWLGQLGMWRELPPPSLQAPDALSIAFPNMDITKHPRFRFKIDGRAHSLDIKALTEDSLSEGQAQEIAKQNASSQSPSTPDYERLFGVEYSYTSPDGRKISNRAELIGQGQIQRSEPSIKKLGAFYIHTRRSTSPSETATALTRLFERKLQDEFVAALRQIDPRVRGMQPGLRGQSPVILVDVGLPRLIPMNALGDGFCRLCLMLTGTVFGASKLVVMDEIDSGLHHSVMAGVWRSLLRLRGTFEFQVFCSTHNEEMLYSVLPAFENHPEDVRVFRLDRSDSDNVEAREYDYKSLCDADKAGFDIR
ncbi:MAG: AAA family ATPase [Verrucomicrobiia bacterium]|jgi:energy-coupling factor transporter ATP-binding protein EcfA2